MSRKKMNLANRFLSTLLTFMIVLNVGAPCSFAQSDLATTFSQNINNSAEWVSDAAWSTLITGAISSSDSNKIVDVVLGSTFLGVDDAIRESNLRLGLRVCFRKSPTLRQAFAERACTDEFLTKTNPLRLAVLEPLQAVYSGTSDPFKKSPSNADFLVMKAFWLNRSLSFASPLSDWFSDHLAIANTQSTERAVNCFGAVNKKFESKTSWDRNYFRRSIESLTAAINNASWKDEVSTGAPNTPLIEHGYSLLLESPVLAERNSAIEAVLGRMMRLWTNSFKAWNYNAPPEFSQEHAYVSEQKLLESINNLTTKGASTPEFYPPELLNQYKTLIEACGGWGSHGLPNAPGKPIPYWYRTSDKQTKLDELKVSGAIPLRALCMAAQHQLQLKVLSGNSSPAEMEKHQYLPDVLNRSYIDTASEPVRTLCSKLRMLPAPIQSSADELVFGTTTNEASSLTVFNSGSLPSKLVSDGDNSRIHADSVALARIALSMFYIWRAEIEYRLLGPRLFGETFSGKTADAFYQCVSKPGSGLLSSHSNPSWDLGFGLLGRVAELEGENLKQEGAARSDQIEAGFDFAGPVESYPDRYSWTTIENIAPNMTVLKGIITLRQDPIDVAKLQTQINKAKSESAAASYIVEAKKEQVAADKISKQVRDKEIENAVLSEQTASIKKDQVVLELNAAASLVDAQFDLQKAAQVRQSKLEEIGRQLDAQVKQLKQHLAEFSKRVNEASLQVKELKTGFDQFWQQLKAHRDDAQSGSSFWDIISKVASFVSVACFGVDVISLAKTAITAVKAISNGDFSSLINAAVNFAGSYVGGEISAFVDSKLSSLATQANLFIDKAKEGLAFLQLNFPTSINDVVTKLSSASALNISDPTKLTDLAWNSAKKLATDIGVSKFVNSANVNNLLTELGVTVEVSGKVTSIVNKAVSLNTEVGIGTFSRQNLRDSAQSIVGGNATNLSEKMQEKVQQTKEKFDEYLVESIQSLKNNGIAADLTAYKAALAKGRDDLIAEVAKVTDRSTEAVQAVLSKVSAKPNQLEELPVLPIAITDKIDAVNKTIQRILNSTQYLTSKDLREKLRKDVEKYKDKDMQKLHDQLVGEVQNTEANLSQAITDVNNLQGELVRATKESLMHDYDVQAGAWDVKARNAYLANADALKQAKAKELLAIGVHQQIAAEGTSIAKLNKGIQEKLIAKAVAEQNAAQATQDGSNEQVQCTELEKSKWQFLLSTATSAVRVNYAPAIQKLTDEINSAYMKALKPLSIFEPHTVKFNLGSAVLPKFDSPSVNELNVRIAFLKSKKAPVDTGSPTIYKALCSRALKPLQVTSFGSGEKDDRIATAFALLSGSNFQPAMKFGKDELQSLRQGVTFWIIPSGKSGKLPYGILDNLRSITWSSSTASRLRLIGVLASTEPSSCSGGAPVFEITQLAGFITETDSDRLTPTLLPTMKPVGLAASWATDGLNSRPLFGCYKVKFKSEDEYALVTQPENFALKLDFASVGY